MSSAPTGRPEPPDEPGPLTPEAFAETTGVSRETLARLEVYAGLLSHWQWRINLIGRNTVPDLWRRHFLDSAQLYPLIDDPAGPLLDLGSGAGFPGLVLAILGIGEVHLIESDNRKAAFLREAARRTRTDVTVHACRIEDGPRITPAILTARALAPLDRLLDLAEPYVTEKTPCLFLKGKAATDELTAATRAWHMNSRIIPSITDANGSILRLEGLRRVNGRS